MPAVTPGGALTLRADPDDTARVHDEAAAARIASALAVGTIDGVLHLGAREVDTHLPAPYAWLREIGRSFVARLCALPDAEANRATLTVPAPTGEELNALASSVPALPGAEYVTTAVLTTWWSELHHALQRALTAWTGTVEAWLQAQNAVWHRVGRVCFHLAERKNDVEIPFAFMATYTTGLSVAARVQHVPFGRALQESADTGDRGRLDALLEPVRRAAEASAIVRALVDSGEVFHPVAWTAREAHAFLKDVPVCEQAGVSVRVPDWWTPKTPSRPRVTVSLGGTQPSYVGADALLDFTVAVCLGDDVLDPDEIAALMAAGTGLVRIRGRWVDIDADRLAALLKQWKSAQRAAADGIPLHQALRMVAGTARADGTPDLPDEDSGWVRIEPGPWLSETLRALRDPSSLGDLNPGTALKATLRPYQNIGLRWLWFLWSLGLGGCLADDMGLGKTVQVIAWMVLERKHRPKGSGIAPHLLVVPASLMSNWRAEIARFAPALTVKLAHPSAGRDAPPESLDGAMAWSRDADVVVTTYGTLARWAWMREATWSMAVLDEAQAIKNPDTRQSRAARSIKARGRLALTGTPIENRLGDLWSLMDFLQPGLLGGASVFAKYARALASSERPDAYAPLRRLVQPYVLRRMKSDKTVAPDLPDKTEVTAWCALTHVQTGLYAQVVEELRRALEDAKEEDKDLVRRGAVLTALMHFKQVCNHPSQWSGDGRFVPEDSGKFTRLKEIAEEIAARGEKVLVFTQFQEMTGPLAEYLTGVFGAPGVVLHGGTPVKDRAKRVEAFQRDPSVGFFVLSLKAGGTGLNLTAAQHVVHFDRWWNPAVEDQATDRAYRIGQKKNVLVHRFVCRGTLEERIDAMLLDKRQLAGAMLTPSSAGAETALTELSDAALMKLVALDITKALDDA